MQEVRVKIKYMYDDVKDLYEKGEPSYAHDGDSGMDVYAYITKQESDAVKFPPVRLGLSNDIKFICLFPGDTRGIGTGIKVAIPDGFEIQARSTSGNSLNKNLVVNNSPGTIDAPYRGECRVILHNESSTVGESPRIIKHGDKIGQFVLCPVYKCKWNEVESLDDTSRGEGGFGSTEKKS